VTKLFQESKEFSQEEIDTLRQKFDSELIEIFHLLHEELRLNSF